MGKTFSGNLKEIILAMLNNNTDCCEVTNTVGDFSVTVDITITKIVNAGEVLYEAENDEVE
jgi:hypothetical protein